MKTITFKTLSILLAAVLLVVALPITAFAESDVTCRQDPDNGEHNYEITFDEDCVTDSDAYHLIIVYECKECIWCGNTEVRIAYSTPEAHDFGDEIDPEVDMCGTCIICGDFIEW